MSNESVEVQLARVSTQLGFVLKDMEAAAACRKTQYETNEKLDKALTEINARLAAVEKQMSAAQPTIEEFITIKHKVVGAGALGKWLWAAGGALLSAAIFFKEHFLNLFTGK